MSNRIEIYEELIAMGYSSEEAWAYVAELDFAEDEEDE